MNEEQRKIQLLKQHIEYLDDVIEKSEVENKELKIENMNLTDLNAQLEKENAQLEKENALFRTAKPTKTEKENANLRKRNAHLSKQLKEWKKIEKDLGTLECTQDMFDEKPKQKAGRKPKKRKIQPKREVPEREMSDELDNFDFSLDEIDDLLGDDVNTKVPPTPPRKPKPLTL